jgi:hypothetical protein
MIHTEYAESDLPRNLFRPNPAPTKTMIAEMVKERDDNESEVVKWTKAVERATSVALSRSLAETFWG